VDAATLADPARPGAPPDAGVDVAVEASKLEGPLRTAVLVAVGVVVAAGLVLRFWARSALWLDEALTVDIARHPLSQLHALLRQDGAPPLYYVLLHFWMKLFGSSNLGVRSLSGVISVLTIPVAWLIGRDYGRSTAVALVVLLASAPFAIYYGTEARMYSLVMLITALGLLAILRAMRRATAFNLVGLALAIAAVLYTQYWGLYLVAILALWLLWQGRKGQPETFRRTNARWCFGALVVGCLAFAPWLPTFVFQSKHTGTPWAAPVNFGAVVSVFTGFTDNQATLSTAGSNEGRLLAVLYLVLAFLAVFGVARDRWHIDLDLHTQPRSRSIAFVVVVTLIAAVAGGLVAQSGYANRYASVVFVPFLLLVALGLVTLAEPRLRAAIVAVVAIAGLAVAAQNVTTSRTQATPIAALLATHAKAGDVVAYCPDQLGPAVYRLTATRGYDQVTYPRSGSPSIIDWVDYKAAIRASSPTAFTRELLSRAAPAHTIWLVWASGYQGYGTRCEQIVDELLTTPGYIPKTWITEKSQTYYEPMNLTEYTKVSASGSRPGS
jgi:mannosyltransferase